MGAPALAAPAGPGANEKRYNITTRSNGNVLVGVEQGPIGLVEEIIDGHHEVDRAQRRACRRV